MISRACLADIQILAMQKRAECSPSGGAPRPLQRRLPATFVTRPHTPSRKPAAAYNAVCEVHAATQCFSIETCPTHGVRARPTARFRRGSRAWCANRGGCWSSRVLLYLALILATLHEAPTPAGRSRARARRSAIAAAPVGAWLADLLLYLFGLSAWWWVIGGVVLVVAGFRRVVRPEEETDHPLLLGAARLRAGAPLQRRARVDPLVEARRRRCRSRPAARSATRSDRARRARSASTARRCCCWRCWPSGCRCCSAFRG